MAAYDFKFVLDNGKIFYVCAGSRSEAIDLFCKEHGLGKNFIKEHCIVTNLGRINK